jgi:L-threonylcarbamoyladenylate synthase
MSATATVVTVVDAATLRAEALAHAAMVLRDGGLVAFPTETFYGLGASATDANAVRRVRHVKGRAASKPLLVLVDSIAMAESLAAEVTPRARELMVSYWPGALTLVLRARAGLPRELTAGTGTIGVRLSPHPIARTLVSALAGPLTAPSANLEGAAPPTTAADVLRVFDGVIDVVLDGGVTVGGLASTVVDVTGQSPRVLRHGAVSI